jgi:2-dehydropantoate 2-reductase
VELRVCVYGAGASGGHLAVKLALAGHKVAVVARGEQLEAIRLRGLTLVAGERGSTVHVQASDSPAEFGLQDVVFVTVKTTSLPAIIDGLEAVVGPDTLVAFLQNGMCWWYPNGLPLDRPAPPDVPIFRLGRSFLKLLRLERVIGGTIYSANEITAPGIVRNTSPDHNRLAIGSIVPGRDRILEPMRAMLEGAGIPTPVVGDIRSAMWTKLMVNMSGSAIALATENKSSISRRDAALAEIFRRLVREGTDIAEAHGYPLRDSVDPDRLLAQLLDHKPSLLQDYERRRPMEIAEIIEAPLVFARAQKVATPTLDALAAIVLRRARDRGLV